MNPETVSRYTILSQRCQAILRYHAGPTHHTLEEFSPGGVQRIELDAEELTAFLRALPPQLLADALVARNAVDLLTDELRQLYGLTSADDPEVAEEVARLQAHCPQPDLCPGCTDGCLVRGMDPESYRWACIVQGKTNGYDGSTVPLPPCTRAPCEER